jgi:hypothetical protein
MRILRLVSISFVVLSCAGCGVVVQGPSDQAASDYQKVYGPVMTKVMADVAAYAPANGPGACNTGGGLDACRLADDASIADIQAAVSALSAVKTTSAFRQANDHLVDALKLEMTGMQQRQSALAAHDDRIFTQSQDTLRQANDKLLAAYSEFPSKHRPIPAIVP